MAALKISKLTKKMFQWLLFTFLIAALIFVISYKCGNYLLTIYFETSPFRKDASSEMIDNLQKYVTKNQISATDTDELREWAKQNQVYYFTISRERMLLYDNSYTGTIPLKDTESVQLNYTWQYFVQVLFEDGYADVFIYSDLESKYYIIVDIACAAVSVLIWFLIFIIGVQREVKYIKLLSLEVSSFDNKHLQNSFTIKGNDEITDLARGLDDMRTNLLEKEKHEESMRSAQNKLLLGMAHDLRTPLTSQIAYLEVIKRQPSIESAIPYVEKVQEKSFQIRNLSDQLFELFMIESDLYPHIEEWQTVSFIFEDYLSELCNLLTNSGFTLTTQHTYWENVQIKVCYDYIGRVFNNISSNVLKYADNNFCIDISTIYTETTFAIAFSNTIAKDNTSESYNKGVGISNIITMMNRMNGDCEITIKDDLYMITLEFPIQNI